MAPTNEDLPAIIIKSDRTGRARYTQQYKDEVSAAYEASGMSGPAFAEHCGVKYPTFASWVSKRRREENQMSHLNADLADYQKRLRHQKWAIYTSAVGMIVAFGSATAAWLA